MTPIPTELTDIVGLLKTSDLTLLPRKWTSRGESLALERKVKTLLKTTYGSTAWLKLPPKAHYWYDFAIELKGVLYPVNIVVSRKRTADNLDCKLGLYFALTGKAPLFGSRIDWKSFISKLNADKADNTSDYWYLVINKNNKNNDIFITSLKTLTKVVPNGNNLPFQAKWNDNLKREDRKYNASRDYLLKVFGESLKLRASAYDSFKKAFLGS